MACDPLVTHRNDRRNVAACRYAHGMAGAADALAGIDEVLEDPVFHLPDGQQPQPDQGAGDRLVSRIMAAEYNLAVESGDSSQAADILARIVGQFLIDREGR
jgi:hypothetical protein